MTPAVPFSSLLAHLRRLNPTHSSPVSFYAPLLAGVLSKLNEPELITELYDDLVGRLQPMGKEEEPSWLASAVNSSDMQDEGKGKVVVAVRMREALLKAFPLIGFPLTISSLTTFSTHLQTNHPAIWPTIQSIEASQPFPTAYEPLDPRLPLHHPVEKEQGLKEEERKAPLEEGESRGRKLFNSIYGKVSGRVIESLRWGHPNLVDCALKLIYTPVLSDLRILEDPLATSMLSLACCFSSDLPPQTKGHWRGAQNLGATDEQIESLLSSIRSIMEWKGDRLRLERMEFLGRTEGFEGRKESGGQSGKGEGGSKL